MKMGLLDTPRPSLPDDSVVCDMIMRMDPPFHVMAWLMAETGCRVSDFAALRVGDFQRRTRELVIASECGARAVGVSDGLAGVLGEHVDQLKARFERHQRGRVTRTHRGPRLVQSLATCPLFPVWCVEGQERGALLDPIPVAWFVGALQEAALSSGFTRPVHSQTLRLVCAQRWLLRGMRFDELHQRLGHRDPLTSLLMVEALRHGGLHFVASTPDPLYTAMAGVA